MRTAGATVAGPASGGTTLATMEIPIACSLSAVAARSQLDEWRDLLEASVARTDRLSPTELSFRLNDDLTQLAALVQLAQREKACCPFFRFVIRIDADAIVLHVSVPEDAVSVLDGFARLDAR
jgi:hypothetical protein